MSFWMQERGKDCGHLWSPGIGKAGRNDKGSSLRHQSSIALTVGLGATLARFQRGRGQGEDRVNAGQ